MSPCISTNFGEFDTLLGTISVTTTGQKKVCTRDTVL